jgi:hypothetical protein
MTYLALFQYNRKGTEKEETAEEKASRESRAMCDARGVLQEHEMASCYQGGEETSALRHSKFPERGSASL